MKNIIKTTGNTSIAQKNTRKRNLFIKTLVMCAIILFGFIAKAQRFQVDVPSAQPGCTTFQFDGYDDFGNLLFSFTSSGAFNSSSCILPGPGRILDHIDISGGGCSSFTYGSLGTFTSGTIATGCTCGTPTASIVATVITSTTLPLCSPDTGLYITSSIN